MVEEANFSVLKLVTEDTSETLVLIYERYGVTSLNTRDFNIHRVSV
jgi:hypothetical protein